ncbi:uncharacterized protein LOC124452466 isoform X2 [Xenia sp. Carnegie-2017]|uniref:uncharacterized protein LOC124452466 isoform X2 n=1 Tax=Xenia sp. Carnegie-2017 TaxID=2897299 RepID=UPI001F039327|nr:uncharacterized protein LOC124452466 isoform X2 [Xenia sp. Carnegie-2017]
MELETQLKTEDDSQIGESGKHSGNSSIRHRIKSDEVDITSVKDGHLNQVIYKPIVPDITLFDYEVQQGYRIFRELLSDQYKSVTYPFLEPVDVEGLNLYDYHTRIEKPMSFKQIESRFNKYDYQSITAIVSDMRLILENCYRYNGSGHWISKLAHKLEKIIDQKLALLNRSLREKVTLRATIAFRNNVVLADNFDQHLGTRPRRSGRSSLGSGGNEETSSLMSHLLLEEQENQREMRRIKDREKREANEALMAKLSEWEVEMFPFDVVKELRSIWEIPAVGAFLWLHQSTLNLPELNYTEFEYGLVLPHISLQMSWILTSLLVAPSHRKSIHKKSPMKFEFWQKKLKGRVEEWYLAKENMEFETAARQIGIDQTFFQIIGETNPFKEKSFTDLTLRQRVLILKVLCDECLEYSPQLRDALGNADTTPYCETYLGYDGENCSYLYFPIFDATDIRVYRQAPLPSLNEWYKQWRTNLVKSNHTITSNKAKSRRRSSNISKKDKSSSLSSIEAGFELVAHDIESLRFLCETFAEKPPQKKPGSRKDTRKHCEKVLYQVLSELLNDLSRNETRYSRSRIKGMLNLMKDCETVDVNNESCDFEAEEKEPEYEDDTAGNTNALDKCSISIRDFNETVADSASSLFNIVTRSRKRKFRDFDESKSNSSSVVSEVSKNFDPAECHSDREFRIAPAKLQSYCDHAVNGTRDICDVVVRGVMDEVIRGVVDVVMNNKLDDIVSKRGYLNQSGIKHMANVNTSRLDDLSGTHRSDEGENDDLSGTHRNGEGENDENVRVNGFDEIRQHCTTECADVIDLKNSHRMGRDTAESSRIFDAVPSINKDIAGREESESAEFQEHFKENDCSSRKSNGINQLSVTFGGNLDFVNVNYSDTKKLSCENVNPQGLNNMETLEESCDNVDAQELNNLETQEESCNNNVNPQELNNMETHKESCENVNPLELIKYNGDECSTNQVVYNGTHLNPDKSHTKLHWVKDAEHAPMRNGHSDVTKSCPTRENSLAD